MHYHHRQRGTAMMAILAPILLFIAVQIGRDPTAVTITVFGLLAFVAVWFNSLTVRVDNDAVRWHFGPGFWRKSVPLAEIEQAEPIRTRWYWGLGIRMTPQGWLYNVSGLDGVRLQLRGGESIILGSDEPEALRQAIESARLRA
ncbi:hypothetical protein KUW19_03305 [Ferrimonas balearica]|uniref:hypothetical protein n=1 Tax=Ferrimonas balearica TaxID=44012 RepID=UPI001C95F280|nr:hypothetical protein [Ferrimonas balearica]MBY6105514.1 hypothetical protein [Ferrimonas balearica]